MADLNITSEADSYQEQCAYCAITEAYDGIRLKKCSKCKLVSYCGKECQKQHWITGGHKQMCLSPDEKKPAISVNNKKSMPAKLCLICRSALDFEPRTEPLMTLPCGHSFHSKCVVSNKDLCLCKLCPSCLMPLPYDAMRSALLNEEASTILSECLSSFKTETGHSVFDSIPNESPVFHEKDEKALKKVVTLHTKAAFLGSAKSAHVLSMIYKSGLGNAVPKDFKLAEFWIKYASTDNSRQEFCHAMMYLTGGIGVEADIEKGKRMLHVSALQGNSQAQYVLGNLLRVGDTVSEIEEGLHFLKMSALQGERSAICDLGRLMYEGKHLPRSYNEAFMLFKEAARQGSVPAMYYLSGLYLRGHGVLQNTDLAETWFLKAEAHGDLESREYANSLFAECDL